jgi:hypothetical protein
LSLTRLGVDQFYLGSPIAVTGGRLMLGANDSTDGHRNPYVLSTGGAGRAGRARLGHDGGR